MNNKLILKLNTHSFLSINALIPLNKLTYIQYANIVFQDKEQLHILHAQEIGEALDRFCRAISENLKSHAVLPTTIKKQDIGYYYARGLYSSSKKWIEKADRLAPFSVWSNPGGEPDINPYLETWLYNDEKGNIVLHITELFRRDDIKLIKDQKIAYKEFMQNYRPIAVHIIPHAIARAWLTECKALLKLIDKNTQKIR